MEGGRAQPQAAPPPLSARWLEFAAWLRQQAGVSEEAVSEASTSDAEEAEPTLRSATAAAAVAADNASQQHLAERPAGVAAPSAAPPSPAAPVTPGHLARHAQLAPRLPDCRAEMRLTSDSCSRARQEMTVMLAAPGMPLAQAPVLTAKQASALMAAICEPLLSLPVGRLTRKLAAPTRLAPTEDRGVLSLWLLPDDSLSLVWQSAHHLASAEVETALGSSSGSPGSGSSEPSDPGSSSGGPGSGGRLASGGDTPSSSSARNPSGGSGAQLPALQQACSVAVWEELAHFPAQAHLLEDAPVVTIHMLRGDASGRSFYIRLRDDVAEANLEAATAAVPDATRLLQQQRAAAAGGAAAARPTVAAAAAAAEPAGAPRMYFWLADKDLGRSVYSLGRLKSLLKRPPTLAKRSGVPDRQLAQLGAWVQRADVAAAEQHRTTAAAAAQQQQEAEAWAAEHGLEAPSAAAGSPLPPEAVPARPSLGGMADAARQRGAGQLSPLLQGGPGLLMGQRGAMAAAAQMQGSVAALPPLPVQQQQQLATAAGAPADPCAPTSEAGAPAVASSTVSATAAALYQDHRFNVVCPCTISVVVGMQVQAAGADAALLPAEASLRARAVAERAAKAAVDRSGRQRIEERLAEVVIRSIRAQRNRARAQRQAQRDGASRQQQAERALALARQATGRSAGSSDADAAAQTGCSDADAASQPAQPAESETLSAAPPPARCEQPPVQQPPVSTSFGVASSSGESLVAQPGCPASSRAFSSPAARSVPTPLLPGGRVTINNLQSLLTPQPPRLEPSTRRRQDGAPVELGSAATAGGPAAADSGTPAAAAAHLSISDLADLLGKHAKLD